MKSTLRLGKVQLRIMQVLWERGGATAREITDELSRESSIAHSTVQTLLRKLEAKGAVRHESPEPPERAWVFRAVHEQDEVTQSATRDLVARLFNNSARGLVAHLLQHEEIAPGELEQMRALIEEKMRQDAARGSQSSAGKEDVQP